MRAGRAVAAILPPVAVAASLCVLRHPRVVYTSDSVAQQSIVRTWLDVGHGTTHVPSDTWALKVPLYLVLEKLPLAPLDRLLAAVLVLNVLTFVFAGIGALLLAPRARWYELAVPLTWLAALGGGIGSNRMLPNYRNVELGLCLLGLGLLAVYLGRPDHRVTARDSASGALVAVLLALLWFDDPYFLVLAGLPIAVLGVLWFLVRERDRRLLVVAGTVVLSAVLLPVLQWVAGRAGITIDHASQLSPQMFGAWYRELGAYADGAWIQLGVDRWDAPAWRLAGQVLVLAGLLAMIAVGAVLAGHGWRTRSLVAFFTGLQWLLVVAGVAVQEHHPSRYLILIVYTLAAATVMGLPLLGHGKAVVVGILAAGGVLTLTAGAVAAIDADRRPSASLPPQQAIVDAVRASGATKGFASFWTGNITGYLAGPGYTAYEIVCDRGQLRTRSWLSDTARLTRPASSSWLVWVPADQAAGGCDQQVRDAQLGPPSRTVTLPSGTQVLTYPYDLATRLPG